jgi:tRNA A37 threonylcarbamoyladenosine dehydratase
MNIHYVFIVFWREPRHLSSRSQVNCNERVKIHLFIFNKRLFMTTTPVLADDGSPDLARRFAAVDRLYASGSGAALSHKKVVVAGIGGVGSWVVEALARSGVGALSLIDLDHIAESNINRQIHALGSTLGQSKIHAMATRVADINPTCQVTCHDAFVEVNNVQDVIDADADLVIDCIDQVHAKIAMILTCHQRQQPLLVCGAAGGKTDALSLRRGDLRDATHDALLARIRHILRKQHGFARAQVKRTPKMGVETFWFAQPTLVPAAWSEGAVAPESGAALACAGYGSAVTVTATLGFVVAGEAIARLLKQI